MKVVIETIPHDQHRYETVGDWWWERDYGEDVLNIRVSKMSDWKKEMAVAEHEMSEALWCKAAGVEQMAVDEFDKKFEADRQEGDTREPGDQLDAPYYEGHQLGNEVEHLIFNSWNYADYEREVMSL